VRSSAWRSVGQAGLLVVVGCLLGLVLAEATYRAYLYFKKAPGQFRVRDLAGYFSAYSVSHWEFDEQFGYMYPPERAIDYTGVMDGHVVECHRLRVINRYGNIGPVMGSYHDAEIKILVFGDSWTAFQQEGRTWPNFLQETLERRLRRRVHVVNFGRDGYGILQMFDLAAAKVLEWKPDFAVIAFITDDLTRARFWRTVVGDGDGVRVVTTIDPVPNPRADRSTDAFLLLPSATHEWCRSVIGTKNVDSVLSKLIAKRRRLLSGRLANVLTLRHSYLYNRLAHRDPFWFLKFQAPVGNPRVSFTSFASDLRFMRDVEKLQATRIPLILFHLAYYPEIKAGKDAILDPQGAALWESLERVTGKRVFRTSDYVRLPMPEPERMNVRGDDFHPSLWGMDFYANVVAEALVRNHLVRR
jgi:hypothetical protein